MDVSVVDAPQRKSKTPTYTAADAKTVSDALAKTKTGQVVAFDAVQDTSNKARVLARKMIATIGRDDLSTAVVSVGDKFRAAVRVKKSS